MRRRSEKRLLLRRKPSSPPLTGLANTWTDRPTWSPGGAESNPRAPTSAPHLRLSSSTATGSTGTPSLLLPRLLLLRHSRASAPLRSSPLLSTGPAPHTETGNLSRTSTLNRHHLEATFTPYSTRLTWGSSLGGTEEEELFGCSDAQGRRRSTAGVSHG